MRALPFLGAVGLAVLTASCAAPQTSPTDRLIEAVSGVPAERSDAIAARVARHPLGSAENPIRVYMPPGQRDYLSRLRCANGVAPTFQRRGSMGDGPYRKIIDGYQFECPGSTPASGVIYMDMYHPDHVETRAPEGFTLVPR